MPIKRNLLLLFPYYLLIFVGLVLPSDGNHGIFSIKSLAFLGSCLAIGLYAHARQKIAAYQLQLISFFFFALAFLILWLLISLTRHETTPEAQMDQFKLFVVTIIFPLLTIYLVKEQLITLQLFLKIVIYSSFFYICFKIIIVALYLSNIIDIWKLMNTFGLRFMSMKIYGGLERLQTSADIVTPFLVFFVLQARRLGVVLNPVFKCIYIALSLFSTFLSFSRYLAFIYIISCFLYLITLNLSKFVKMFIVVFCGIIIAYLSIGPERVKQIVDRRVVSKATSKSDEVRTAQIRALLAEYQQVPYLGKGLGGYSENMIRDPELLHNYEVQWVAFLMQFGVLGIVCIAIPYAIILCRLIGFPFSRLKAAFACLFILWILSGFMNPFLISLTSGIIYALFLLSADRLKQLRADPC